MVDVDDVVCRVAISIRKKVLAGGALHSVVREAFRPGLWAALVSVDLNPLAMSLRLRGFSGGFFLGENVGGSRSSVPELFKRCRDILGNRDARHLGSPMHGLKGRL